MVSSTIIGGGWKMIQKTISSNGECLDTESSGSDLTIIPLAGLTKAMERTCRWINARESNWRKRHVSVGLCEDYSLMLF